MRTLKITFLVTLQAATAVSSMAQLAPQFTQAMDRDSFSFRNEFREFAIQDGSSQSGSGTVQPNMTGSDAPRLDRYPDRSIDSVPAQPVTMRYVVEHRSALNGKTITVKGVVANTIWPSTAAGVSSEPSMANPQPRIFLADSLRKRRDKNFDLMVLLREGERGYVIGQSVKIKVRVNSNKSTVVMRKQF